MLRDIENHFKYEEKHYHTPVTVNNFWSNNYIEYESDSDRNKRQSFEEYLNKVRPYLENIINNLKKSDTGTIQLTITNKLITSIGNDKEHVVHSKSDKIQIMVSAESNEVIN